MQPLPLLNRILKIIAGATALFVSAVALLIVSVLWEQHNKDREWEQRLSPSIQFVNTFKASNTRLPSDKEFENRPSAKADWMVDLVTKDSADPAFKSHGGKRSNDYCLRIWRGERWTYYFSWNGKYDIVDP